MNNFNYQVALIGFDNNGIIEAFIRNLTMNCFSVSINAAKNECSLFNEGFTVIENLKSTIDNLYGTQVIFLFKTNDINELLKTIKNNSYILNFANNFFVLNQDQLDLIKSKNINFLNCYLLCSKNDVFYDAKLITNKINGDLDWFMKLLEPCFKSGIVSIDTKLDLFVNEFKNLSKKVFNVIYDKKDFSDWIKYSLLYLCH